jgi:hypothetical protein
MSETEPAETETVLIFQREHSNRIEEWIAPHNKVRLQAYEDWVTVEGEHHSPILVLRHIVEAHLITRPKQVDISD